MQPSGSYALCIYDLPQDDHPIVQLLVDEFDYHPTDAKVRMRRLPGLLSDRFSYERATQLAVKIENAGAHAGIVEENDLPDIKHAPLLRHVRCEGEGLQIVGLTGEITETISWTNLIFLTVGLVPGSSLDHAARPQVFMSHTDGTPPVGMHRDHHPPIHEFWIATENPDRCFRFQEHQMNFEYLGERKSTSGTENCKLLVRDLQQHAPHIASTASINAYMNGDLRAESRIQSAELFHNLVAGQIVVVRSVRKHELERKQNLDSRETNDQ